MSARAKEALPKRQYSTVVYSDVKIEVGSKATPFIPGVIPSVLPFSLTEQLVPGEFFADRDGTLRHVYCRSFVGTTPASEPDYSALSLTGPNYASVIADVRGTVESGGNWYCFEPNRILAGLNGELTMIVDQIFLNRSYRITVKFTKFHTQKRGSE